MTIILQHYYNKYMAIAFKNKYMIDLTIREYEISYFDKDSGDSLEKPDVSLKTQTIENSLTVKEAVIKLLEKYGQD